MNEKEGMNGWKEINEKDGWEGMDGKGWMERNKWKEMNE